MAENENPKSRNETILNNMLGESYEIEAPKSRNEKLLQQILENGGGSGGIEEIGTILCDLPNTADATYRIAAKIPASGQKISRTNNIFIKKSDIEAWLAQTNKEYIGFVGYSAGLSGTAVVFTQMTFYNPNYDRAGEECIFINLDFVAYGDEGTYNGYVKPIVLYKQN